MRSVSRRVGIAGGCGASCPIVSVQPLCPRCLCVKKMQRTHTTEMQKHRGCTETNLRTHPLPRGVTDSINTEEPAAVSNLQSKINNQQCLHPVLFNFPALLAHSSTRKKIQRPTGISTAPISARINSSEPTDDNGAPARCSAVEAGFPTPNNLRHAESV